MNLLKIEIEVCQVNWLVSLITCLPQSHFSKKIPDMKIYFASVIILVLYIGVHWVRISNAGTEKKKKIVKKNVS